MNKEKIRSLEKMPPQNKLAYCKVLALMVGADLPLNQIKMAELYRLFANIRIATNQREEVLYFLMNPDKSVNELCEEMMENVSQQERNILRFSLIKDLMIIMEADYIQLPKEQELLQAVEEIFRITAEQKEFFKEEFRSDQMLLKEDKGNALSDEIIKETIAKAAAVGIPLSVVYFSGLIRGFGPIGTLLGLETIGGKKYTKRYSSAVGLGIIIIGAFSTYHLIKWGLNLNKDDGSELKALIKERMDNIHQRGILYLKRDIELFDKDFNILLRKTLAIMKNTKPRVI